MNSPASVSGQAPTPQCPLRVGMHDRGQARTGGYNRAALAGPRLERERPRPLRRCGAHRERLRSMGVADLAGLHRRPPGDGAGPLRGGHQSAELRKRTGILAIDWLLSKRHVWRSPHMQPIHLLRRAFEQAPDFAAARHMLESTQVCSRAGSASSSAAKRQRGCCSNRPPQRTSGKRRSGSRDIIQRSRTQVVWRRCRRCQVRSI